MVQNSTYSLTLKFCESGICPRLAGFPASGIHQAAIKALVKLCSLPEAHLEKNSLSSSLRLYAEFLCCCYKVRPPAFCWLSAGGHFGILEAGSVNNIAAFFFRPATEYSEFSSEVESSTVMRVTYYIHHIPLSKYQVLPVKGHDHEEVKVMGPP